MIICLHLCGISDEESLHKENITMSDDSFVHNIWLALITNLLAH